MGITRAMSTVRDLSNLDIDTGIVGSMVDNPIVVQLVIDYKGLDSKVDVYDGVEFS